MPLSGTATFNEVKSQIIRNALITLGVAGPEDTIDASDYSYASDTLDEMLKNWEAGGIGLWLKQEATLFLQPNQYKYQIGGNSPDHAALMPVVETILTTAAISTATTLILSTVKGMSVNDKLGIIVTDGTVFWTTISAINTGTLTVTINDALLQAAPAATPVYTYTTDLTRPYGVTQMRRIDSSGFEVVIDKTRREDYFALPNKDLTSIPVTWYTDPQLAANFIYLWPSISDASYRIRFTSMASIQDSGLVNNTLDFPQEWIKPCRLCLAVDLAPAYGKEAKVGGPGQGLLYDRAKEAFDDAKGWDVDTGVITFTMAEDAAKSV